MLGVCPNFRQQIYKAQKDPFFAVYLQVYEPVFYFVESIRVCYTQFADTAWK